MWTDLRLEQDLEVQAEILAAHSSHYVLAKPSQQIYIGARVIAQPVVVVGAIFVHGDHLKRPTFCGWRRRI